MRWACCLGILGVNLIFDEGARHLFILIRRDSYGLLVDDVEPFIEKRRTLCAAAFGSLAPYLNPMRQVAT